MIFRISGCVVPEGPIAGKPAPTGSGLDYKFVFHPQSLWELACQRRGHQQHHKNSHPMPLRKMNDGIVAFVTDVFVIQTSLACALSIGAS